MGKKVILALGGGGIRGIAHLGVIRCLEDHGYSVAGIAGTSMGSLIGALYASGAGLAEVDQLLERFTSKPSYHRKPGEEASLLGTAFIEELLRDFFKEKRIEDLPIKFAATAVNIDTEKQVVLSSGNVVDAILASIAIPGIFPAQKTDHGFLIDGGVLDPVPVGIARQLDPSLPVIAVCLNKKDAAQSEGLPSLPFEDLVPKPISERMSRSRYYSALRLISRSIDVVFDRLADANLLLEKPDVMVTPLVGHYQLLSFSIPSDLQERGYEAMENQLAALEKSRKLIHSFIRVSRYVERSEELKPAIQLLTASQKSDQRKK